MFQNKQSQMNQGSESSEQRAKVKELRDALGPLPERSTKYCTDACLRRYLEARVWNVEKSKKMVDESLKWRSQFKPEEIRWSEVAHEGETGKVSRADFHDKFGRAVLILRPGMQNTKDTKNNIRHLVYLMENAVMNLGKGQEQMSWLIDFTGLSVRTDVSVRTARETINILQNHYPERLAVAFLYDPPRLFESFWRVTRYFLDSRTFQKVKFVYPNNAQSVDLMASYFDTDNLPTVFGGKATLHYDHLRFSTLMKQDDAKTATFWGLPH